MVNRKGAGYAMEAIVAVATVIIFVLGGLTVPNNQDWSNFRSQVSADDLTYAMQESGYLEHALSEGEIGSVQTAISSITERDIEVSGLVSNLPIAENSVAFYTLPSNRYTQGLEPVNGGCEGDLNEISTRSEEPVLRTDGNGRASVHSGEVLYVADLDPKQVGGNNQQDYDSLWVDNGTACQFSAEEGPFSLDSIFLWGTENYDLESIGSSEMRIFQATQAVRFRKSLEKRVNSINTFVSIDAVNFTELEENTYNVAVLRSEQAVEDVDSGNIGTMKSFMESGSLLVLANLTSNSFDSGDFLSQSGFRYVNVSYNGSYSGDEISGIFPSNRDAQDTQTYFVGLGGVETDLSVVPPKVISNTQSTLQSSPTILRSPTETYNFSAWNRTNSSMESIDPSAVEGEPDSACYSTSNDALTRGKLRFPDGETYRFINAELGTSASFCNSNEERGVKVDTDQDNSYSDQTTLLNDQVFTVANRRYALDVNYDSNPAREIGFTFIGDKAVELVSRRKSFPGYEGGKIAVSGYENIYEKQDMRMLTSVIHWLRGDEVRFTGLTPPEDISTSTYSGIKNKTYMPYELNLRWSR